MFYSIKRFGLEFANEIDRRTYEEAMYNKSLDPAMDPVERYDLIRAFLFRKNEDTILRPPSITLMPPLEYR